ncbi:PREDICTED: uncharacterized protein LOC108782760 [Cyphomyrmex costatus]|uniref:uncharacterized protein LOC108782760 n=1 Tax=Cyphomyrmex costatus TaxID=456900 RepID=UPI0008523826|nr:PREDICTED: uncharacterized protein LOC108782760 [Cyphomyrmex costatus]
MKMANQDEIRTLVLSLLIARKGSTPVTVLERDYYEIEKKRIPYKKFGYNNLVHFLQSMPDHFVVEEYEGIHYVRGIANKSKHVSSLVSRQKTTTNSRIKYPLRQATTFNRRNQHTRFQQVRLTPDKLCLLVQYIKSNPNGVSLQNAVLYAQQLVPHVNISSSDLHTQLYELSHQLCMDGYMIYAVQNGLQSNVVQQPSNRRPLIETPSTQFWNEPELSSDSILPPKQTEYAAGQEDFEWVEYFSDEGDFVSVHTSSNNINNCKKRAKTSELLVTNLAQHVKSEQTDMFNYNKNEDDIEINENDYFPMNYNNTEMRATECSQDKSEIVSDRIKTRLRELLQKYPNGIWCAELPDIYLKEYKVHLNYNKLGFTSVREFTSYLPKIFYMTQVKKTDDFKLYSADKRPVVPNTELTNEPCASQDHRYDERGTAQTQYNNDDDKAPIPSKVSPKITKKYAPDEVMNYGDDVNKILVTDLKCTKKYLEIYVIEVFNPSFFWIHLRENVKQFENMMDELSDFYELNKYNYTIPNIALKENMHCACVYDDRWHRAVIKKLKVDNRATVWFYDYGTVKAYAGQDLYYLHSKFSILPAQAIPCGLYDVKPNVDEKWKKSVNDKFVDKIADTLLAVTIITVDPQYNSMMVVLTDTSEEEDVCINNWLVKEKLAQVGKMVGTCDIINYLRFDFDFSTSIRREDNINKSQHCRDQSVLYDERMHVLSDVKGEDIEQKTVKSLHNIPASKIKVLQLLSNKSPNAKSLNDNTNHTKSPSVKSIPTKYLDANSLNTSLDSFSDTKSSDAKLQSSNSSYLQNRRSRTPKELISVLEKLEKSKLNGIFNSNSKTSISEANENNVRQIDSSRKKDSQCSNELCYGFMNFISRDSDNESDQNDFGTFRSLYGGHGLMEPIDWSVIRQENNLAHRTIISTKECKSNVEDKSESYNQRNKLLDILKDNILYTVSDHTVTVMFTPNVKLKTLHDNQSDDTNSSINIVERIDIASSEEIDQKVNKNDKVYNGKVKADQKIRDKDSNTDSESVFFNMSNNIDNTTREMSECSSNDSSQSNTNNKTYNPRFKTILDKMKRKQMNSMNSNFINISKSSSSEQIPLSSYSCNTSDDTIISSHDEQFKASNVIEMNTSTTVKKYLSEKLSKKLTDESHSDSEETRDLSSLETDSIISSNIDDTKQCLLNQSLENDSFASNAIVSSNVNDTKKCLLDQSLCVENDSFASSNADSTKQYQNQSSDVVTSSCNINDSNNPLITINETLNISNLMQKLLKITQNVPDNSDQLDSDDLSQESVKDDNSDESKRDDISDCISETYETINDVNIIEKEPVPLIFDDCDIASDDSEWDAGAGSDFLSELEEMFKVTIANSTEI